jgi:hypothetical protein
LPEQNGAFCLVAPGIGPWSGVRIEHENYGFAKITTSATNEIPIKANHMTTMQNCRRRVLWEKAVDTRTLEIGSFKVLIEIS